ncbi:MAG: divisome protein SepX/GlpR [Nocardioidaceae bacterium]
MLTGVIYGAIVVAWATYLVPLALRRDEQASRTRSIERLSTAMRVLVSRGSRVEASPPGQASKAPPTRDIPEPQRVLVAPRPNRAGERAAAARRRIVLYALMSLTLAVGLASVLGLVPWWSFVLPLVLIAGFLVIARRSVRNARKPYWVEVPPAVATDLSAPDESAPDDGDEDRDEEDTITLTAAQRKAAAAPRVANGSTLWDPLPVTLPTYVDAPVARRAFRTITLGAEAPAAAPEPVGSAEIVAEIAADAPEDVPRAVNG